MAREVIRVVVSNRTTTLVRPYDYDALIQWWSYSVPGYKFMHIPGWDGRIKLLKRDRVPTGLFLATREEIERETGTEFRCKFIRKWPGVRDESEWIKSDREYQNDCVDAMYKNSRTGGLVIAATASGKTYITAMYASRVEGPLLFVVDQLDLLWQAKKEIQERLGEKVGFVGESKFKPRRITIGTVQTLHGHRKDPKFGRWTKDIQVVLIDEIHVQLNRRNFDVVMNIQPRACFGLTATLQKQKKDVRLKAYGLCGPEIYTFPVAKGMKENVLSKGIVVRCKFKNEVD